MLGIRRKPPGSASAMSWAACQIGCGPRLHQSTPRKVDVLATLAGRANANTLETNATWWELHGVA